MLPTVVAAKLRTSPKKLSLELKEEQVHELITHVGRFSDNSPGLETVLKAIVPCDIQF
ncbi:hypothetical protein Bca101_033646 [Brassica carinata]